ncbi:MAG: flagellar brake protein [Phycisphaerae bacterium]
MKTRRTLAARDSREMFDLAVQDRALAVVSIHDNGVWESFKVRFLERDPRGEFFVLDHQSQTDSPLPELVPGRFAGVSFRHRSRKVLFSTMVQARGHFVLDKDTSVPAIRYRWPESVTELQRRSYYRTPVPESQVLTANIWPHTIATNCAPSPIRDAEYSGQLLDLSCGGTFIRLNQSDAPTWIENSTVGVELELGDNRPPLRVDARFRGVREDKFGQPGVAVQFIGLELTVEGRLALQRLANTVQRYHRLAMMAGSNDWHRQ